MVPQKATSFDISGMTDYLFRFLMQHGGTADISTINGLERFESRNLVINPLIDKGYILPVATREGYAVTLTSKGRKLARKVD